MTTSEAGTYGQCPACGGSLRADHACPMKSLTSETESSVKSTLLKALNQYAGDNLERATAAFRHCTTEQMQQEYGQSGETRQAILDGYRAHREKVDAAFAFVRALP